jgi:hypothetical protein
VSLTAAVWSLLAVGLFLRSFQRPIWAACLYMLTFFAAPQLWWWGNDLPRARYSFISGIVLAVSVALYIARRGENVERRFRLIHVLAIVSVVNATLVHVFIAARPAISIDSYTELVKYTLLFFLLWYSVQNRRDFKILLIAITLGSAYLGYEITFNERGGFLHSRLEGIGAPGADTSNGLASLMLLTLPLIGSLFMHRTWGNRALVAIAAPLTLNTLLLCNSRGAFLGLIGAGLLYFFLARGAARKEAFRTLLLGALALYLLLGDPDILNRFMTTFVGSEERDQSASLRIVFWRAGLLMLADYPLGAGGAGFKFQHGSYYLPLLGTDETVRSLHNGFLTEATDWGIQGLLLRLSIIALATIAAYRTSNACRRDRRGDDAVIGNCMIVAMFGFMIGCVFGSFLSNEWTFWILALLVRYSELYAVSEPAVLPQPAGLAPRQPAVARDAARVPVPATATRSR